MRATALAAALCLSAVGFSATPEALASIRKTTHIEQQELGAALRVLEKDRNLQLIFLSEDVSNLRTGGASGELTFEEALKQLLAGTGLTYRFLNDSTVTIIPTAVAAPPAESRDSKPADSTGKPTAQSHSETGGAPDAADNLETVQVTGSRLQRAGSEGAQPVTTFGRDQVERSGRSSVTEFLRTLPEVSGASIVEAPNGAYPHVATIQLRGLPAGRTLMLVNGRRLPSSGNVDGGFANLNTIPQGAVERIDVLPQGASAIYGSDALAGVVNVILRKDVDMAMLDTKYGYADGIDDRTISAGWGTTWDRGSVLLMGEYYDRTSLFKDERDITRNADFTRDGWRDLRSTTCNPGTVYADGSGNLPGLGANSAAIPAGLDGVPTIADLAGGVGQINRCGSSDNIPQLIYPAHRYSFVGVGDFKLTDDITLFSELWYSRLHHDFASVAYLSKVAVPASNPFNPFGTTVRLDYQFGASLLGDTNSEVDEKMRRAVLGARGKAFGSWDWEVSGTAARDNSWTLFMISNPSFVPPELASADPQTAFDPFTSGAPVASDVLRSYVNSGLFIAIPRQAVITTTGGNLVLRGSLFDLPAGAVSAAFGGEYGHERFENSGQRGPFDVGRNNKAAFAEVRVPVLARSSGAGARDDLLTVTAAIRRDDYSDFGNATTPQYGLEIHPVPNLLLRASYSEAFRAPDLYAVYGPPATGIGVTVFDPRRNGELTPGLYYSAGGNPNLQPETGRSVSAGFVWSSVRWEGLRTTVNWWKVAMSNRISLFPSPQLIVNNEGLFPDRVTRAAPAGDGLPGAITAIDYSALNLGDIWVDGIDFDVTQRVRMPFGTLVPSVRISRNMKYDALLNPAVGISDYLGNANTDIWVPKLRGTVGLGFERAAWSASIDGRYVGRYKDYNPLNNGVYQHLGNTWTWDLNARWDLGSDLRLRGSWLSKLHVALGAVNVFDRQPQFSASNGPGFGFDAGQYDIRGRYAYAQIGVQL